MKLTWCVEKLSGHQMLLTVNVFHLLLRQQWRFKMAVNLHLPQFIWKTSSMTPIIFANLVPRAFLKLGGREKALLSAGGLHIFIGWLIFLIFSRET